MLFNPNVPPEMFNTARKSETHPKKEHELKGNMTISEEFAISPFQISII